MLVTLFIDCEWWYLMYVYMYIMYTQGAEEDASKSQEIRIS